MKGAQTRVPQYRIVAVGDPAVGKTSILNRLMEGKFDDLEPSTVGATWQLFAQDQNGQKLEIQIWDTAGQEKFRALGPLYYRGAVGAVVVYDVTNRQSFANIEGWIEGFTSVAGSESAIVIVGNKTDRDGYREVPEREGREWARERSVTFYETSAKTGTNVAEVFDALTHTIASSKSLALKSSTTGVPQNTHVEYCC
jgi:small GTP-binding protein